MDLAKLAGESAAGLARFLADSNSVYLLVAALDGRVRHCNAALTRRLKIASTDVAGLLVWNLIVAPDGHSLRHRLAEHPMPPPTRFLLNYVDANHCPFTLECRLEVQPDYFLLLGEVPTRTNDVDQEELLRLNNEMAVLNRENARRGRELERALNDLRTSHWQLKKIQEVLPICMMCGQVKTTSEWEDVLSFLKENAPFLSHGYCPTCAKKLKADWGIPQE